MAVTKIKERSRIKRGQLRGERFITSINSNYTQTRDEDFYLVDSSGGAIDITLLDATTLTGRKFDFVIVNSSNPITLTPQAGQTINGASSFVISSVLTPLYLYSDGTTDWILTNDTGNIVPTESQLPLDTVNNRAIDRFSYPFSNLVTVGARGRFAGNTTAEIKQAVDWVAENWGWGTVALIDREYTYSAGNALSAFPSNVNLIGLPYEKSKIIGAPAFGEVISSSWRNKLSNPEVLSTQFVDVSIDEDTFRRGFNPTYTIWFTSGTGSISVGNGTASVVAPVSVSSPGQGSAVTFEVDLSSFSLGNYTGTIAVSATGTVEKAMMSLGTVARDYTPFQDLSNNIFQDLIIDCQDEDSATAMKLYYPNNVKVIDCEFENLNNDGWHLNVGVDATGAGSGFKDSVISTGGIEIIRPKFTRHSGRLEMLLLFNISGVKVDSPEFYDKGDNGPFPSGPTFGLWDKVYRCDIVNPLYVDCKGFNFYYGVDVSDVIIENSRHFNAGQAVSGARPSDYTHPDNTVVPSNINWNGFLAVGGDNSSAATAVQFGRINHYSLNNFFISKHKQGIKFDGGGGGVPATRALATYGKVSSGIIVDINPDDTFKDLNVPIIFGTVDGDMYLNISDVTIYDTRASGSKTLDHSVAFDDSVPNLTFNYITFDNCSFDFTTGNNSIRVGPTITLGAEVKVINPMKFNRGSYEGTVLLYEDHEDITSASASTALSAGIKYSKITTTGSTDNLSIGSPYFDGQQKYIIIDAWTAGTDEVTITVTGGKDFTSIVMSANTATDTGTLVKLVSLDGEWIVESTYTPSTTLISIT